MMQLYTCDVSVRTPLETTGYIESKGVDLLDFTGSGVTFSSVDMNTSDI